MRAIALDLLQLLLDFSLPINLQRCTFFVLINLLSADDQEQTC
jgi:hypothetical protein